MNTNKYVTNKSNIFTLCIFDINILLINGKYSKK